MRYFVNIKTGVVIKDYIVPTYRAYWREITEKEYKKLLKKY